MTAALLGAVVLLHQTIFAAHAQPILVAAGLALYGVPASNSLMKLLARKLLDGEEGK